MIVINLLNTELNPICHLLALLEAHHILHISRIRVNSVTECKKNVMECRTYHGSMRCCRYKYMYINT